MRFLALFSICTFFVGSAFSAAINSKAPQGGTYTFNLGAEPPTIHPITYIDVSGQKVQTWAVDSLAERDIDTYEWVPRLAEKWEIAKDGNSFTFWLRKNAFFHDGTPITAEDVKFSFDAIFEDKYKAADKRPYYENLAKVEVIDSHTVKFYVKSPYFQNFESAAGLSIIPKHVYSDVEKSNKMNREIVGSGPYVVSKFDKGQKIVLKKFDKWYGNSDPTQNGSYNFDTINLRFVQDENVALEMLKKGELDYDLLTAEQYSKRTEGPPFGKTVIKYKERSKLPKGYGFIGWNMKNILFKDKKVRLALYHLLNRREMIKKFRYGLSEPATGPSDKVSEHASDKVKVIEFDPKKAQVLFAEAGWKDSDKNGILDKEIEGKKTELKITLIFAKKDFEKYLTIYKEDLKKAGVDLDLKFLEWTSFVKLLDEQNFDAVSLAWSGGVEWDPKQVWHSASAVKGGSNFISYKNPEVDKLIDVARIEMDKSKRTPMLKKVYEAIAEDVPYAFLFNDPNYYYATSSRIKKLKNMYNYDFGERYWWVE